MHFWSISGRHRSLPFRVVVVPLREPMFVSCCCGISNLLRFFALRVHLRGIFLHRIRRNGHDPTGDKDPRQAFPPLLLRLFSRSLTPEPSTGRVIVVLVAAVVTVVRMVVVVIVRGRRLSQGYASRERDAAGGVLEEERGGSRRPGETRGETVKHIVRGGGG
jgi:hypothetical protein